MVSPNPSTQSNCSSDERGYQRIRFRQDTAENWLKNDPILASGEMGYVIGATEGPNLKVGDGWVRWSQLPWITGGDGTAGTPGPQGPAGPEGPPGHDALHIVSEVEPPPGEEIGDLWIDPTATTETATVTVDLSAYATTDYVDATKAEIIAAVTPALQERYTKQEVDAKVAALQQGVTDANLGVQGVADLIPFVAGELGTQIDAKLDLKADKTTVGSLAKTLMDSIMEVKDGTYTKPEVDEAIAGAVSGQLTPEQITEIISQVGPVDLTDYAKISDNTQAILAKTVVTQAVGFGDSSLPPVALTYTDTGEGYGPRLVFAVGMVNDYVALRSDFDPLKSRMDVLGAGLIPLQDKVSEMASQIAALTARIEALEARP